VRLFLTSEETVKYRLMKPGEEPEVFEVVFRTLSEDLQAFGILSGKSQADQTGNPVHALGP